MPKDLAALAEDMANSMADIIRLEDQRKKLSIELQKLSETLAGADTAKLHNYNALRVKRAKLGKDLELAEREYAKAALAFENLKRSLR